MVLDVNVIWIKEGLPGERVIRIDAASQLFESTDITDEEFWEAITQEHQGSLEFHEHLKIDVDRRSIVMDGNALRYDWFSIKEKILKLRKYKWRVVQLDSNIVEDYPWLKEELPATRQGRGWHGEPGRHSIKRKVAHIRKKHQRLNQEIRGEGWEEEQKAPKKDI